MELVSGAGDALIGVGQGALHVASVRRVEALVDIFQGGLVTNHILLGHFALRLKVEDMPVQAVGLFVQVKHVVPDLVIF